MIAPVQNNQGTNSPASYSGAVTAGNLLTITLRVGNTGAAATVSDSVNGSWTLGYSQQQTTDGHTQHVLYFPNSGAGSPTITVTNPGGGTLRWITEEWSGVATSSPVRGTPVSAQGAAAVSSGNITASVGDLVMGSVTNNNSNATTWVAGGTSAGGSFVLNGTFGANDGSTDVPIAVQYVVATGAGTFASFPTSVVGGGSVNCTSGVIIFEPPAAAPTAPQVLLPMSVSGQLRT